MNILKFISGRFLMVAISFGLFSGCAHYISTFDQLAYVQATSLKVDVLNLIDESTESYASRKLEVEDVVSKMMKAIEYEKHRSKNDITVRMWNKLIDSTKQKGIVGSYLASWKRTGTKSQVLIDQFKPLASEGFDLIAELEAQKIKPSDAGISKFLNK